jgi:hypothetical protein
MDMHWLWVTDRDWVESIACLGRAESIAAFQILRLENMTLSTIFNCISNLACQHYPSRVCTYDAEPMGKEHQVRLNQTPGRAPNRSGARP